MKRYRSYRRFGYAHPHDLNICSTYRGGVRL